MNVNGIDLKVNKINQFEGSKLELTFNHGFYKHYFDLNIGQVPLYNEIDRLTKSVLKVQQILDIYDKNNNLILSSIASKTSIEVTKDNIKELLLELDSVLVDKIYTDILYTQN